MTGRKRKSSEKTASRVANPHSAGKVSALQTDSLASLISAASDRPDDIDAHHALAKYYLRHKQEEKIISAIEPVQRLIDEADPQQKAVHQRLVALGHAFRNELLYAETASKKGLESDPDALDYLFVRCFVNLSFREYDKAAELGAAYVERYHSNASGGKSETEYTFSESHLSQVHNSIGSAYYEQDNVDQADVHFRRSIVCDPGNSLPYINLARLLQRHGNKGEACEVIKQGLAKARDIQDLRLLNQSLQNSATISACMMVKNEEELLPGCLDSIRDWVDEIVIVDTGSTDRTIEIAESYGAKIYHQPWEANFSKHRNYSTSLATGGWVFIIDADERFMRNDVPLLLETINSDKHDVVSVNVHNTYGETEHKVTLVNSPRFFRRDLNLQYEGIVHNSLKIPPNTRIARAPFSMEHLGYDLSPEKMKAKHERSHALLLKQIEDDPDSVMAWFNLAQLYRGRVSEDQDLFTAKTITCAKKVIELTSTDDNKCRHLHIMAHDQIAWMKYLCGELDEAADFARKALDGRPDYLDSLMLLGHIHADRGEHATAISAYEKYLAAQARFNGNLEVDAYILTYTESRAMAYFGIGCMAELMGARDRAAQAYRDTLREAPDHTEASLLLGRMALEDGDLQEAGRRFRELLKSDQPCSRAAVGMACVHLQRNDYELAAECFEKAIQLNPEDRTARVKAAEFYQQVGQLGRARELFQLQLTYDQTDVEALHGLAAIYYAGEKYDQAAEFYRRLLDQPEQANRPEILNDLGNCLYRTKAFEEAKEKYRAATRLPDVPSISYRNLGLVSIRMNLPDEALDALKKYRALEPGDHQIIRLIADLLVQSGNPEAAIGEYEEYLSRVPNSVEGIFGLSEAYFLLGHVDSAIIGFRRAQAMNPGFAPAQKRLAELGLFCEPIATN